MLFRSAVARVEPECDGEAAARLDGGPVGGPLAPDGQADEREEEVEGGPRHAELCFPLVVIERLGRGPQVVLGVTAGHPDAPPAEVDHAADSGQGGEHEGPPPSHILPQPPVALQYLPPPPTPHYGCV